MVTVTDDSAADKESEVPDTVPLLRVLQTWGSHRLISSLKSAGVPFGSNIPTMVNIDGVEFDGHRMIFDRIAGLKVLLGGGPTESEYPEGLSIRLVNPIYWKGDGTYDVKCIWVAVYNGFVHLEAREGTYYIKTPYEPDTLETV